LAFRIRGGAGAKRKKGSDEEATDKHAITPFFGELPMLETDSQNIKEALLSDVSNIAMLVNELNLGQLKEVLDVSGKGVSDQNIRKLAQYHTAFIKIEAMGCFTISTYIVCFSIASHCEIRENEIFTR
jgi:hypothetical protein